MTKKKTKQIAGEWINSPYSGNIKISFFIPEQKTEQSDRIIFKILDGHFSGCIVNVSDFKFADDDSAKMLFDYNIAHIPDGITINDKKIQTIIKKAVRNILQHAVRNVSSNEESANFLYVDS